ncbi:cellobiose transport system permease protein [Brachybacterium muris]|uniref:carbohydrate ABC transporter permease n=1 Tax=Brachybacterium muris TaxID=219301 RepID=UPI0019586FA9|nr:carbohydrate ABC transporter permease [Brachybacterium muris]MBM7500302.1 cellobiose transport system permease protein [Brachybacterium muris]MCT1430928.1 carbohydrate ABC transporter permease [Brachybacterium muris]
MTLAPTPTRPRAEEHAPAAHRPRLRPGRVIRHVLLLLGALVSIFPFYWMIVLSSHRSAAIFEFPPPLLPGDRFMENFTRVMDSVNVWAAMGNTVVVASTVTFFVLLIDSLAAFAFAKFSFRGKNVLFLLVMLTFLLPSQLATIPQFLMMTELGWVGELKSVIVPSLAGAFGIFWLRQFFQNSVRTELIEAATIDGCGFFRQYFHVALPSGRSAMAFLGMFTFIGSWNDFMWPLIVLNDPDRLTLQVALSQLQTTHGTDYGMLMMSALIAVVPLILVFIIGAKQFIAGITDGAVK